jgi:hypothetical protein
VTLPAIIPDALPDVPPGACYACHGTSLRDIWMKMRNRRLARGRTNRAVTSAPTDAPQPGPVTKGGGE